MITIPEYFSKYINNSIDLNTTPKVCCPFHQEDTPSFSYSALMKKWVDNIFSESGVVLVPVMLVEML